MDKLSDRELREALLNPDLKSRKRAHAREILRRRYESDSGLVWRNVWVGVLFWLGSARASLSRRQFRTS